MTSEHLIEYLREVLLQRNMQHYRRLFVEPLAHANPDSYCLAIRDLYSRLSPQDRDVLFSILRQTIIDTTSTILSVLDGVSCIPGYTEDFSLRYGTNADNLVGDLQDLFLAAEEESESSN